MHIKLKIERENPTKNPWWSQVFRKGRQFLIHLCRTSYYSSYKPVDKSWMRKGPEVFSTLPLETISPFLHVLNILHYSMVNSQYGGTAKLKWKWKRKLTVVSVINLDICDIHSINRKWQHPPCNILLRVITCNSTWFTLQFMLRSTNNG